MIEAVCWTVVAAFMFGGSGVGWVALEERRRLLISGTVVLIAKAVVSSITCIDCTHPMSRARTARGRMRILVISGY